MEFKTLYQELANSTEMIRVLLLGVTQEKSSIKPDQESWSILEVVCHLYDEEREDFHEHLDFILHRQNEEWHQIDPQSWVTEREYIEQNFIESQKKFFAERTKSLEWLKGLADAEWETTYSSQFGSMKAGDMFASWIAHDNLHIRQLVELRRKHIEEITKPYDIQYAGDW
jgi:DinB superfamily